MVASVEQQRGDANTSGSSGGPSGRPSDNISTSERVASADIGDALARDVNAASWDALMPLHGNSGGATHRSAMRSGIAPDADNDSSQSSPCGSPTVRSPSLPLPSKARSAGKSSALSRLPSRNTSISSGLAAAETTDRTTQKDKGSSLSFENLYAKLLIHCDEMGIRPSVEGLESMIAATGIQLNDRRMSGTMRELERIRQGSTRRLTLDQFTDVIRPNLRFMLKVLNRQLVVPDFVVFANDLQALAQLAEPDHGGANADYIPVLRDADPDRWGVAVCTTDGQMFTHGDVDDYFSIQSSSKPVTYALAMQERGEEFVHSYIGQENSGQPFNAIVCLPDKRPHNPYVNAGAIMAAATLASGHPDKNSRQMTQHVMDTWSALCGHIAEIKFSDETFEAERSTADNNYSLAWFIKARRGLPPHVTIDSAADFYFSCCSIEATCRAMSVVASTLANGGVCPLTNQEVFSADTVKKVLSLMQSCGMYDASGAFLYQIGLPAKSGVSGVVISVVPNVLGIATFSPRLDSFGNSVRGVKFNRMLVDCFSFHVYDNLSGMHSGCKKDPRLSVADTQELELANLRFAIKNGDQNALDFQTLLLETMVATSLADGNLAVEEVSTLSAAYKQMMESQPSAHEIATICNRVQHLGMEGVEEQLQRLCPELDDVQREIILEAVFAVATADGHMADAEVEVMGRVAAALQVPPTVMELKIFEWKEELECTAHLPLQDDTTRSAADILQRAISADTADGGGDIHDVDAARQMAAIEEALKTELERPLHCITASHNRSRAARTNLMRTSSSFGRHLAVRGTNGRSSQGG